jgi:hypothetical protein
MAKGATLALKITGDASGGVRALDQAEGKASKFGKAMGGAVLGGVGVAIGAIGMLGKASFDAASELQQSTGAIDAVFGDWAVDIEQSAQAASDAVGLSASSYENLAAVIGAQLAGAGMAHDQMTSKTQGLIEKGADLAATFGGTTADAVSALSSVLKGETDPIERYGVSIKQSDINARLAAQGQDKLTGTALKTATANAALALVMDQTKSSTGAFAKEGDTAAGSGERLSAKFENLKAALGEKLLPIFTDAANFVMDKVIPAFEDLTAKGGPLSKIFSDVGTFIKTNVVPAIKDLWKWASVNLVPILKDIGKFITETVVPAFKKVWQFVQDYVIPIFKKTLTPALKGVREAFHTISEKINDNKDKFQKLYDKAKPFLDFVKNKLAPLLGGALKKGFEVAGDAIGVVVDLFAGLIDKISWILDKGAKVGEWIGGLFAAPGGGGGAARPVGARMVGAAAGGGLFAAASSIGGGGGPSPAAGGLAVAGDTYNITVTGALDPQAVADQIAGLLDKRARRTGRSFAVGLA